MDKIFLGILTFLFISIMSFSLQLTEITLNGTKVLYPTSLVATSASNSDVGIVKEITSDGTVEIVELKSSCFSNFSLSKWLYGIDLSQISSHFFSHVIFLIQKIMKGQYVYIEHKSKDGKFIWVKAGNKFYLLDAILILKGYERVGKGEKYEGLYECEYYAKKHKLGLWKNNDKRIRIIHINAPSQNEYVEIKNVSEFPINLQGWKLKSDPNQWYTFSGVVLQTGQSIKIHSGSNYASLIQEMNIE